jgi:general secretion pathway protein N
MLRLTVAVLLAVVSVQAIASTSGTATDRPDVELAQDTRAVSPVTTGVLAQSAAPEKAQVMTVSPVPVAERALSANPLWAIPLTVLSSTRDRPIFSPSRRPPAPAIAPVTPKVAVVSKPRERERPQLNLVGTIASGDEGFGIFLDQSTKTPVRLKVGEDYQGWTLRSVQGREAILEKDQLSFILELPQPTGAQTSGAARNDLQPSSVQSPPAAVGKLLSATSQSRPGGLRTLNQLR